ncbi:MAG: CheR family methyltransferase, partial [Cyanobacteria bacterium P01_F01_bin.116]
MSSTEPFSPRITQAFTQLIAERIGLTFRKNDQAAFQKFILSRLQPLGFSVPEEYYLLLHDKTDAGHQEWETLITEITNTESFFFRDKGQFSLLKNYIFPKIIEQQSKSKTIRICSAGCSTGEEPYSIAILLKNLLPDLRDWEIKILGVDVNIEAIQKAKTGLYRPWSFRGIDPELQKQFFQETNQQYQLHDDILAMVDFQTGNLLNDSFFNPSLDIQNMDLILCRNVFIYFSQAAIEKTIAKFYDALSPLGYLL